MWTLRNMTRRRFFSSSSVADDSNLRSIKISIWNSGFLNSHNGFKRSFLPYAMVKLSKDLDVQNSGQFVLETARYKVHLHPKRLSLHHQIDTKPLSTHTVSSAAQLFNIDQEPHHKVSLKNLDDELVSRGLEKFLEGRKFFTRSDNQIRIFEGVDGCKVLYELLVKAGIRKLVPKEYSLRDYVTLSPNNLGDMLLRAADADHKFTKNSFDRLLEDPTLVRIRIWGSGYFMSDDSFIHTNAPYALVKRFIPNRVPNIGHVSVETKGFYASLWPNDLTILNKLKVHDGSNSTIRQDLESEGRPPDYLIDFYSLDVKAISDEIDRFTKDCSEKSTGVYHLIGINANSCSTLAYKLLISGGIKKLAPLRSRLLDFSIVTPNNLAKLVVESEKADKQFTQRDPIENDNSSRKLR